MPLMVAGSQDDIIVDPHALQGLRGWFKQGDRLWECPNDTTFSTSSIRN